MGPEVTTIGCSVGEACAVSASELVQPELSRGRRPVMPLERLIKMPALHERQGSGQNDKSWYRSGSETRQAKQGAERDATEDQNKANWICVRDREESPPTSSPSCEVRARMRK